MSNQPESPPDTPTFAELAADPAIAPLLDFEPVPLRRRANGWDADAQRAFIAHLAITGSKTHAADAVGRAPNGADQLLKREGADSFRDAHDRALAFFRRNHQQQLADGVAAARRADPALQAPGQVLNEAGEYEDRDSLDRRAEDARDSISAKLQRARRLYLREISGCAGKRAAFEILTELPVDWDAAARLEPQPDEPWRKPSMRAPDMLLTAESGWMGDFAHGPNRMRDSFVSRISSRASSAVQRRWKSRPMNDLSHSRRSSKPTERTVGVTALGGLFLHRNRSTAIQFTSHVAPPSAE